MANVIKERLKSVKSLVPKGARLLDIGSDHAALPIALFREGSIKSALITDINEKPLSRARSEAAKAGFASRCVFLLSDGFDNVSGDQYDAAAVCGMGGTLMIDILERGSKKGAVTGRHTLLLQPMTDHALLRKYLWDSGFDIEEELFALEGANGQKARPYVIMKVRYDGKRRGYTFAELFLGKKRTESEAFRRFKEKTIRSLSKRVYGISVSLKPKKTDARRVYRAAEKMKERGGDPFIKFMKKELLK